MKKTAGLTVSSVNSEPPLAFKEKRDVVLAAIAEMELTDPHAHLHRFHVTRYAVTLDLLPDEKGELLDLGGYCGLFSTLLKKYRSYSVIAADHLSPEEAHRFDFEKDPFPFADSRFDVVLFMEVLEHFREDPMRALSEINRVLRPGGLLLLTTPNLCSWKSIRRALNHQHPDLFPPFLRMGGTDRHNREYTAHEVRQLAHDSGFEIIRFETIDVYEHTPGGEPIAGFDASDRGDTTFCLCRKVGPVVNRMPTWLYWPN